MKLYASPASSFARIADYLDSRFPQPRFIPEYADAKLEVRRREALADGVMEAVSASLYEMRFHDEAKRSEQWLARQLGKADAGLTALETMLGKRQWLVGDAVSLADIAIACHLGFITLRAPQFFPRDRHPGLTRLWQALETRDSMRKMVPPPA
jgi:glutathione S-transferase